MSIRAGPEGQCLVIDYETRIQYHMIRVGYNHADVEPATKEDW